MNYQEYRAAKEAFLQTDPLRLDCMNTQKALSGLVPAIPQTTEEYSLSEALAAWQEVTGFDLQQLESIPGTGVRELLAQLIEQLKCLIQCPIGACSWFIYFVHNNNWLKAHIKGHSVSVLLIDNIDRDQEENG